MAKVYNEDYNFVSHKDWHNLILEQTQKMTN